jgi:hypothetical protein
LELAAAGIQKRGSVFGYTTDVSNMFA